MHLLWRPCCNVSENGRIIHASSTTGKFVEANVYEKNTIITIRRFLNTINEFIFDPVFYADKYPDLKNVFGYDSGALRKHYLEYGIKRKTRMYYIWCELL